MILTKQFILSIIEQLEKEIPIDGRQDNFHMIHDYEDRWRVLKERVNNLTEGEYNEKV